MCRSTDYYDFYSLKIKSFFVRLSGWPSPLPESLTLLYLPRISEAALDISGSRIRPDSPAFVTLHRVVGVDDGVYGSREWVRAGEGVRFEVYSWEDTLLKGILRRDDDDDAMTWRVDCKCALQTGRSETAAVAEICVGVEGHPPMTARVEMKRRRRRKNRRMSFDAKLEEIPEERETERELDGGCCCSCGGETAEQGGGEDGGDCCEMEGVGWAVDVGIWVACLGVGYLVSKASSKSLRRLRIF